MNESKSRSSGDTILISSECPPVIPCKHHRFSRVMSCAVLNLPRTALPLPIYYSPFTIHHSPLTLHSPRSSLPPHFPPSVSRLPGRPFAGKFSAPSAFSAVNSVAVPAFCFLPSAYFRSPRPPRFCAESPLPLFLASWFPAQFTCRSWRPWRFTPLPFPFPQFPLARNAPRRAALRLQTQSASSA